MALGDSYASGAGLSGQTNATCLRSSGSYPVWLKKTYKISDANFKNVTCSGATTRSLWNDQGPAHPQLNALSKNTDLVTVSIGGNDLGFSTVLADCVLQAQLKGSTGSPCRTKYNAGGQNLLEARIAKLAPRIGSMVVDIKRRSPAARVVVVGYPTLFPAKADRCGASVPLADGDVTYLDDITRKLNSMLANQARGAGAAYADTYSGSQGTDMCQPQNTRWVNPLLPLSAGSAHPTGVGHLFMANRVFEALK
ncbi:SGNH/GDSL hydrolase family protein [Streptomyces sp. NBC_00568]|uniref:SGNH/GDSL hydrolase family protein n=1 Tax=Streptomyces sp. NBC_00568 TaxID=2975779 RepID=UPI002256052B|nr:SGNH/GDSL hydrolase family protein [Streptomyces sp. NBC_00568]